MKTTLALLAVLLTSQLSFAQNATPHKTDSPKLKHLGPLATKVDARLLPGLNSALQSRSTTASAALQLKENLKDSMAPASSPDSFVVRINCDAGTTVVAAIKKTGARVIATTVRWKSVTVEATLDQINALSAIPGVQFIHLETGAGTSQSGAADNHADIDMKTDQLRANYNLTGAGQKFGVLSDSCNHTGKNGLGTTTGTSPIYYLSSTVDQNSGDLPSSYQVLDFGPSGGGDEGAAMMELIYDICPGASFAFASAFHSQTSFAQNIGLLRTVAQCTVIADDIYYYEEPFFQDGPIAQAVNDCVAAGVPYFTAAGNHAANGVLEPYNDVNPSMNDVSYPPSGNDFHNWGIGGATPAFLPIQIGNNVPLTMDLQWNQPFASYGLGAGSESDLDMYLYSGPSTTSTLLAYSENVQGIAGAPAGDPAEFISYTNKSGVTKTCYLAINHYDGLSSNVLRLVFFSNGYNYTFPLGGVSGPTIYGHMASKGAITVGAIDTRDIATGGLYGPDFTHINAESFSSKGGLGANGIPIYYTTTGTLIANGPELRNKPDIAAADGCNTRFFGSDSDDPDGWPNFYGTSAAAPNAAAVAGLLLEKSPGLTPAQIRNILQSTAQDIVASSPNSEAGPDDFTGSGLISALAAGAISGISDWAKY